MFHDLYESHVVPSGTTHELYVYVGRDRYLITDYNDLSIVAQHTWFMHETRGPVTRVGNDIVDFLDLKFPVKMPHVAFKILNADRYDTRCVNLEIHPFEDYQLEEIRKQIDHYETMKRQKDEIELLNQQLINYQKLETLLRKRLRDAELKSMKHDSSTQTRTQTEPESNIQPKSQVQPPVHTPVQPQVQPQPQVQTTYFKVQTSNTFLVCLLIVLYMTIILPVV
jgi:hypothetical protein